jgi:hypothetical protein
LVYLPTEAMVSDILTKSLPRQRFEKLRLELGVVDDEMSRSVEQ